VNVPTTNNKHQTTYVLDTGWMKLPTPNAKPNVMYAVYVNVPTTNHKQQTTNILDAI
jgi:hypothetical protein